MIAKPTRRFCRKAVLFVSQCRWVRVMGLVPLMAVCLLVPSCSLLGPALSLGMAKIQFGCLPEGTRIDTPDGPVNIESLKAGDTVIGFDGKPVQISQIHQYREDAATSRYLTVHFTNGAKVSTSARHRIDGIPACELKAGDRSGSEIVSHMISLNGISRSFDLLTDDAGYRIGGIPVNSMIAEMAAHRLSGRMER